MNCRKVYYEKTQNSIAGIRCTCRHDAPVRGRVVTKDEFLKNVWEDEFIGEGTLAVHIRHLREKVERDRNAPEIIKTVWGVG